MPNTSSNNGDYGREERRKASFALAGTSTYILILTLLAGGGFAVIISTATPMTVANAQELDNTTITTTGQPGGGPEPSVCTPTQTGGGGGQNATTNATTAATMSSGNANATTGNANATTGAGVVVSPSTSEVRDHIEQACIALEVGDIEGALMQLNLALGELASDGSSTQGNNTDTSIEITGGTATAGGGEGTFEEGVTVGGTSAADDYDATADAEGG
jgi:hypothetical protein